MPDSFIHSFCSGGSIKSWEMQFYECPELSFYFCKFSIISSTDKYPEICCIVMFFFMNQRYASLMKIIVNKNQVVNKLSSIFDSSDESLSKVL